MELVEFLRARLDDDERVASDAGGLSASRRRWMRDAISCVVDATDNGLIVYGEGTPTPEQAEHITRHDPARVLREVEAKQRILEVTLAERHKVVEDCWYTCPAATEEREGDTCCNENEGDECNCGRDFRVDRMQRLLALPYADHPDYDESWKP